MATSTLTRDFSTIRADLLARAGAVFPEWTDRDPSDFGVMLLDSWAHAADVLNYYIDRAAGEASLTTATQRDSVLSIANLLDYTPRGRSSATASLTLQNTSNVLVAVSQFTPFAARNDSKSYQAYSATAASVPANSTVVIPVTEGTRYVEEVLTSSSTGIAGQRYTLSRTGVDTSTILCYVYEDGVTRTQYQFVSNISLAATGDRSFSTYTAGDGTIQIILGTALNGFVPPTGAKVTSTYAVCSGSAGNLPGGTITGFSSSTPMGIGIVTNGSFSGGLDEESIASMQRSIPSAVSAQNRAVTRSDYIALALQIPGVAKASLSFVPGLSSASAGGASVGTNASVTIYPQAARSDFLTTTDTFQAVSAAMQANVVNTLQPLACLGVTVLSSSTIQWQGVDLIAQVFVEPRYVQAWVQAAVVSAIGSLFSFDNVIFGQLLHLGQVYQIINNVPGVQYVVITRFDKTGSTGVQTSILVDPLKLPKQGAVTLTMSGGTTTSS